MGGELVKVVGRGPHDVQVGEQVPQPETYSARTSTPGIRKYSKVLLAAVLPLSNIISLLKYLWFPEEVPQAETYSTRTSTPGIRIYSKVLLAAALLSC